MLLDSFCVPDVPHFTITTTASDFVPLGLFLQLKPIKKAPNTMMQKHFLYFFKLCKLASWRPTPSVYLISYKTPSENRASERPSDRSTERSIDRAIQRFFVSECFFHLPPLSHHSKSIFSSLLSPAHQPRAGVEAINHIISYQPLATDGLVGYREANRISSAACINAPKSWVLNDRFKARGVST